MRPSSVLVPAALAAALAGAPAPPAAAGASSDDADRAAILRSVETVLRPGAPGALCVTGDDAFAVLTGDPKSPEAVVAAARAGKGRVVVFAHDGYVAKERFLPTDREDGAARLLRNAICWAGAADPSKPPEVLIDDPRGVVVAAARTAGLDATKRGALPKPQGRVLVLPSADAFAAEGDAIAAWVRNGGGLVIAQCPWGWEQIRGVPMRTHMTVNRFLASCGIVFADGIPDATGPGNTFAVAKSRGGDVHAGEALRALEAGAKDAAATAYLVEKALRSVPPDDTTFLPRAAKAASKVPATDFPRPAKPLRANEGLARLAVAWRSITWRDLAPEDVRAAPGADEFPGTVPAGTTSAARALSFDGAPDGWRSSGLYLAPGAVLTVATRPTTGAKSVAPKWKVRIGCHSDELWHLDEWKRWPEVSHTVPLAAGTTRVATPWGGLVWFEGEGRFDADVAGAVDAPIYDLRDPDRAKRWSASRRAPGPWAELVGECLAISLPSEAVRGLDDPEPVVRWWDSVVKSHFELAGEPLPARPERFVADVQISAGYMHSGYPIMMHLDVATPEGGRPAHLVDAARLAKEGTWGPFHELGHNRQKADWTFEGTGEVTCNLFSLWSHENLCRIPSWNNGWLEGQKANARQYLKKPDFGRWKSDPGIALVTYAQVVKQFGWAPVKKVFAECLALPDAQRPRSETQKIDQFVVRLSKACGRDLRPHFRRWAWPLSDTALRDPDLAKLPAWDSNPDEVKPGGR